jgi:hypothetical protein
MAFVFFLLWLWPIMYLMFTWKNSDYVKNYLIVAFIQPSLSIAGGFAIAWILRDILGLGGFWEL